MSTTMSKAETMLLREHLSRCRRYLEFGSGDSTKMAVEMPTIEKIDVIESDRSFAEKTLLSLSPISAACTTGRLTFHFIDIGPISAWGRPREKDRRYLWPTYSLLPFAEGKEYDFILVDGIFRGACVLAAFLSVPQCPVLIHDFWNRTRYHFLLEFGECKDRADTMALLVRKKHAHVNRMMRALNKHQYLPDDESLLSRLKTKVENVFRR